MVYSIIIGFVAFLLGVGGTWVLYGLFSKKARQEAEVEAELLKKNKLSKANLTNK